MRMPQIWLTFLSLCTPSSEGVPLLRTTCLVPALPSNHLKGLTFPLFFKVSYFLKLIIKKCTEGHISHHSGEAAYCFLSCRARISFFLTVNFSYRGPRNSIYVIRINPMDFSKKRVFAQLEQSIKKTYLYVAQLCSQNL